MVVTCRTGEYEGAVAAGGLVLATAAVVELEPVDLDSAAAFLTAVPSGVTRWQPVLDVLRARPDAPLAHALASPLMVALARAIYTVPATEPGELLGLADQDAVERRLLEGFISCFRVRLRGSRWSTCRR